MDVKHEEYLGYNSIRLSNGQIRLWLAEDFGLRLIGFALADGENMLAELPEARIEVPGAQDYLLRGGHRLWYGPEVPARTYLPDDRAVVSEIGSDYLEQRQPVDTPTGVEKSWRIILSQDSPSLSIDHRLANTSEEPITLAPWAITMLKPGGLGIFPQQAELSDPNGLQPNRHLILWPYTPVQSEHIQWRDDAIYLHAALEEGALKIGSPNPIGWLAYLLGDIVFVKSTDYFPAADYIDRGASSQVYCNPGVIELETLGPSVLLRPGERVEHREVWELYSYEACRQDVRGLYTKYFDQ